MDRRRTNFFRSVIAFLTFSDLGISYQEVAPTAVRKLVPDANEKLLAQHLAFAPVLFNAQSIHQVESNLTSSYRPAFSLHQDDNDQQANAFPRAALALSLLQKRTSCPSGFNSCADIGNPNKCCEDGTYCSYVSDSDTGHVACCPNGATCGGAVGTCPSNTVTCPSELGGGCCIAGYVCQGDGCVPSAAATSAPPTATYVQSVTSQPSAQTITQTRTTVVAGNPSTVIVTVAVTRGSSAQPKTETTTVIASASSSSISSGTNTATGDAPYRPVSSTEQSTTQPPASTSAADTQTGCPTGFYGCLATHGGGCCQTDRNCQTYDCPAASLTPIVSDGATIVVAATGAATAATSTCAQGWFLCGKSAGPVAGCCPSGYSCGTVSCFTVTASQTEQAQKEFPTLESSSHSLFGRLGIKDSMAGLLVTLAFFTWVY